MATTFLILSLCLSGLYMSVEGMYDPNNPPNNTGDVSHFSIMSVDSSPAPPHAPAAKKAKKLYFDFTEKIDNFLEADGEGEMGSLWNYSKKEGSKRPIPNVFYSTDSLVSNLETLSPVTDLLDENELTESPLYLSFRMMNGSEISGDRIADVFYSLDSSIPEEKRKSLRKHVSRILLDIQEAESYYPRLAGSYAELKSYYSSHLDPKWDIPFPKYAKKIANKLLGSQKQASSSLKVGVMYNETQANCMQISPQLKHADFIVINVNFEPERIFPLTYYQFKTYLKNIEDTHMRMIIGQAGAANGTEIMFKITLQDANGDRDYSRDLIRLPEFAEEIVEETKQAYLPILKMYAKKWTKEGESELILSHNLKFNRNSEEEGEVVRSFCGKEWFLPYLHVQEVDVSPCQLRTMLGHMAEEYSSVVVNEYTWSAFARQANEMTSKNCPKGIDLPKKSPSTYLTFTPGIGAMWNKTEKYFEKLLQEHQTISGWNLDTLIFPSQDLRRSACQPGDSCFYEHYDPDIPVDQGIPRFATEMSENYKIGCLVEFSEEVDGYSTPRSEYRLQKTQDSCRPLWNASSVIVWKYSAALRDEANRKLSFSFDSYSFKRGLLPILSDRADFIKEFPDKEVILQIDLKNIDERIRSDRAYSYRRDDVQYLLCSGNRIQEFHDFYKGMQTWAGIHGVKLILTSAYDVEEPLKGLWLPPGEDGVPSKHNMGNCSNGF